MYFDGDLLDSDVILVEYMEVLKMAVTGCNTVGLKKKEHFTQL